MIHRREAMGRKDALMVKLKLKLYPADQVEWYLLIDIITFVFLFYHVLTAESPIGLFGTFLLLALFLVFFYVGLWYRDWRLFLAVLAGCALLSVLAMFYNQWLLFFGIVFADLLGRARSKAYMGLGMLGFVGMYMLTHAYLYQDAFHFLRTPMLPLLIIQLIIPVVIRMLESSNMLRQELAAANERIARYVQEEERNRLARDLHDTLGQTLTMIKTKGELALRLMEKDPERAKGEIREVIHTSRFALKQVRDLVTAMRHVSLEGELEQGRALLTSSGIKLRVDKKGALPPLSKVAETMLALALREAFTNIVRHSQATQCLVTLQVVGDWVHLIIEDDGIGLSGGATQGHGLASIRERLHSLQGQAEIGPSPAGGVKVHLSLPIGREYGEVRS